MTTNQLSHKPHQSQVLLNAEDVAERLAISKSFAYQLMRLGEIPIVKLGRAVRVREQDLIAYVAKNTQATNYSESANLLTNTSASSFLVSGQTKGERNA